MTAHRSPALVVARPGVARGSGFRLDGHRSPNTERRDQRTRTVTYGTGLMAEGSFGGRGPTGQNPGDIIGMMAIWAWGSFRGICERSRETARASPATAVTRLLGVFPLPTDTNALRRTATHANSLPGIVDTRWNRLVSRKSLSPIRLSRSPCETAARSAEKSPLGRRLVSGSHRPTWVLPCLSRNRRCAPEPHGLRRAPLLERPPPLRIVPHSAGEIVTGVQFATRVPPKSAPFGATMYCMQSGKVTVPFTRGYVCPR